MLIINDATCMGKTMREYSRICVNPDSKGQAFKPVYFIAEAGLDGVCYNDSYDNLRGEALF